MVCKTAFCEDFFLELTPPQNGIEAPAADVSPVQAPKTQEFTAKNTTSVDDLMSRAAADLLQNGATSTDSATSADVILPALPDSNSPVQLEEPDLDSLLNDSADVTSENAKSAASTSIDSLLEGAFQSSNEGTETSEMGQGTEASQGSNYVEAMKKRNLAQMQAQRQAAMKQAAEKQAAEQAAAEKQTTKQEEEQDTTEKQDAEQVAEQDAAEKTADEASTEADAKDAAVAQNEETPAQDSEELAKDDPDADLLPDADEEEPEELAAKEPAPEVRETAKAEAKPAGKKAKKASLAAKTTPSVAKQAPNVGAKVEGTVTLDSLMTGDSVKKLAKTLAAEENTLRENAIVRAIRSARPAVVNIRGEKVVKSGNPVAGEDSQRVNGMGTGILIDSRGYILTNYHVVDGISEIQVTTEDSRKYTATVLERDPETDLAIIRIMPLEGEAFETIRLGHSRDLLTGETVIAVGNAFGYEHTVTTGIISAQHRSVQVSDVQFYNDLIQTDASINPGNSGGPLLNIRGEMIGINVAVRAGAQGIGFAIPVDKALEVAARMVSHYASQHFWHGLQLAFEDLGAKVLSVEKDSPAQNAGLRAGDWVCAVNNQRIRSEMDFAQAVLEQKAGDTLELKIVRGTKKARTELTLGSVRATSEDTQVAKTAPSPAAYNAPVAANSSKAEVEARIWEQIGVEVIQVSANSLDQKLAQSYKGGLQVQKVRPNSPAARQGVRAGDVLLGVMRWETLSVSNLLFVMEQSEFQNAPKAKFLVGRGGSVMFGYLGK